MLEHGIAECSQWRDIPKYEGEGGRGMLGAARAARKARTACFSSRSWHNCRPIAWSLER
jgi:hypothetical protein